MGATLTTLALFPFYIPIMTRVDSTIINSYCVHNGDGHAVLKNEGDCLSVSHCKLTTMSPVSPVNSYTRI